MYPDPPPVLTTLGQALSPLLLQFSLGRHQFPSGSGPQNPGGLLPSHFAGYSLKTSLGMGGGDEQVHLARVPPAFHGYAIVVGELVLGRGHPGR